MSKLRILVALLGALLATGCFSLPSLHPLFTDSDLIFDPALAGVWTHKDGDLLIVRQSGQKKAYQVLHVPAKASSTVTRYEARLARLGGVRMLDILPEQSSEYVPSHYFASLRLEKDQMRLAFLDSKWLRQQIAKERTPAHTLLRETEEQIVLTASTKELEQFVMKYCGEQKAYEAAVEFRRIK